MGVLLSIIVSRISNRLLFILLLHFHLRVSGVGLFGSRLAVVLLGIIIVALTRTRCWWPGPF